MRVSQYAKSIVMVLSAGLAIFVASNSDGVVTPVEYVNIGLAILTAITAYLVPNLSSGVGKYAKSIIAFGGAALTALSVIVAHSGDWSGVTQNDWIGVLLAGLAAIGLFIIPNNSVSPAVTVTNISNAGVDPEAVAQEIVNKLPVATASTTDENGLPPITHEGATTA